MTQDCDEPFVDTYLLYLLAAASRAASAEFHAIVRAEGLRVPEWRVLACLHDRDGLMITHMVDIAFVEQSNLTKIVDQMDDDGLVERRKDPQDRRRVRIWLTDKGRALTSRLVAQARQHETDVLGCLPDDVARRFKSDLRVLVERVTQEKASGDAVSEVVL